MPDVVYYPLRSSQLIGMRSYARVIKAAADSGDGSSSDEKDQARLRSGKKDDAPVIRRGMVLNILA
ncbi:MAG TPA: hypothetical protein VL974_12545 [Magnetospirillum sp.]|jgi:hypothetical protein|nr:hypothetical protein [Magnetospirillum sp.]